MAHLHERGVLGSVVGAALRPVGRADERSRGKLQHQRRLAPVRLRLGLRTSRQRRREVVPPPVEHALRQGARGAGGRHGEPVAEHVRLVADALQVQPSPARVQRSLRRVDAAVGVPRRRTASRSRSATVCGGAGGIGF
jgi:hypothetical protein